MLAYSCGSVCAWHANQLKRPPVCVHTAAANLTAACSRHKPDFRNGFHYDADFRWKVANLSVTDSANAPRTLCLGQVLERVKRNAALKWFPQKELLETQYWNDFLGIQSAVNHFICISKYFGNVNMNNLVDHFYLPSHTDGIDHTNWISLMRVHIAYRKHCVIFRVKNPSYSMHLCKILTYFGTVCKNGSYETCI